jgi:hypothetical protein
LLALWAADCAEHILPLWSARYPEDDRPQQAIATARAWARGEVMVGAARKASVAAHAAARATTDPAAIAVARAAGHAVATAHMADHAQGPVYYARKAMLAAGGSAGKEAAEREHAWQLEQLPEAIRALIVSEA